MMVALLLIFLARQVCSTESLGLCLEDRCQSAPVPPQLPPQISSRATPCSFFFQALNNHLDFSRLVLLEYKLQEDRDLFFPA